MTTNEGHPHVACAACAATTSRNDGRWLPRRGGWICGPCAARCACGILVEDPVHWDADTDVALCDDCLAVRLRRHRTASSDRTSSTPARPQKPGKTTGGETLWRLKIDVLCRRAALAWQITPDDWSDAVEAAIRAAEGGGDLEMRHRVVIDAAIAADRASGSELMTRDLAGLLVLAAMRKHLGHVQVVAAPSLDVTSLVAMSDGLGTMMFAISLNALDGGDRDDPPGVFVATAVAEEIARFRSMEPDALLVKIYVRALLRYRDGMSRRIAHPAAGVRDHWMLEFVTGMLHEVAGQDFRSGMRDLIS